MLIAGIQGDIAQLLNFHRKYLEINLQKNHSLESILAGWSKNSFSKNEKTIFRNIAKVFLGIMNLIPQEVPSQKFGP